MGRLATANPQETKVPGRCKPQENWREKRPAGFPREKWSQNPFLCRRRRRRRGRRFWPNGADDAAVRNDGKLRGTAAFRVSLTDRRAGVGGC